MDAGVVFFTLIGAAFVVGGFAVLLNLFGAADRAAANNRRGRDNPWREPGYYPETRGGARLWGLTAIVCGAVVVAFGTSELSGDSTAISCSYKGAPARVLTVTVGDSVAEIRRRGTQIEVRDQVEGPARCSGDTPTVRNTDTMRIVLAEVSFVDLDLSGGAFAPGATREPEGASEIEIELSVDLGTAEVNGTSGDGGPGDDTISGGGHDDELSGDAGNDRIDGRARTRSPRDAAATASVAVPDET